MYSKRIKIFIAAILLLLFACLLRLTQMQLIPSSSLQDQITQLKLQRGYRRQLNTLRGKILDRNTKVLAVNEPQFQLCINYQLCRFLDPRIQRGKLLKAAAKQNPQLALADAKKQIKARLQDLFQIIDKCTYFGL